MEVRSSQEAQINTVSTITEADAQVEFNDRFDLDIDEDEDIVNITIEKIGIK